MKSSEVELTQLIPEVRAIPPVPGEPTLVELYDSGSLDGHTPGMRVQVNMVVTADGAVTGRDGRTGSISSPADMRVFSVLRALADAVVVGASTARIERYTRLSEKPRHVEQRKARGQRPVPILVIISRSGQLDLERLAEKGTSEVVVHTSTTDAKVLAELRDFCGAENVVIHQDSVAPEEVLSDLRARGARRVLSEGGPTLLGEWVTAGIVDELCLTISPLLAGETGVGPTGLLDGARLPSPIDLAPLSLLTDSKTYIQRLAVHSPRT
jgi:riboflavin biosynthesis pyrimidine reductase